MTGTRHLIPLGEGVYTVSEVCQILQPSMTARKVHYWLNTGLLSEPPVAHRGKGHPTLLSFRQLLEVRTVQRMRDDLGATLPVVREAFAWVLSTLFASSALEVKFERGSRGRVVARTPDGDGVEIPTLQAVLNLNFDATLAGLNAVVSGSKVAWERQAFDVPNRQHVIADAHVQSGAPTIKGTRVETALVAGFAEDGTYDGETVDRILRSFPRLSVEAVEDALEFEGMRRRAA